MVQDTLTGQLAEFIADGVTRAHDPARVIRAKAHLLDTVAAIVSGASLPAGRFGRAFAVAQDCGPGVAGVAMEARKFGPAMAAFANAMCAHADETDDAHQDSTTHPGAAVVPAALAMAQARGGSGRAVLGAIITGYELCGRIGCVLGSSGFIVNRGFDTHAFGGVFGAAAAAAVLTGIRPAGARTLLSLAAHEASGLATVFRDPHHVEKAYVFAGKPARDGVTAALLVDAGLSGVGDAIGGLPGFLSAYGVEAGTWFDDLGQVWAIERTNIKRWCVGSPAQAALDAVEALRADTRFALGDIESILVELPAHGARVVDGRDMPSINVQHLVALMLHDGGLSFASSHDPERMTDPGVLALRQRVTLSVNAELTREEPRRQAIVTLVLRDGARISRRIRAVRGTVDNPMSLAEVEDKARDLIGPALGREAADSILAAVRSLDDAPSIAPLARLLSGPA